MNGSIDYWNFCFQQNELLFPFLFIMSSKETCFMLVCLVTWFVFFKNFEFFYFKLFFVFLNYFDVLIWKKIYIYIILIYFQTKYIFKKQYLSLFQTLLCLLDCWPSKYSDLANVFLVEKNLIVSRLTWCDPINW
jgi:hypothetical protein